VWKRVDLPSACAKYSTCIHWQLEKSREQKGSVGVVPHSVILENMLHGVWLGRAETGVGVLKTLSTPYGELWWYVMHLHNVYSQAETLYAPSTAIC
jgi:hypothetical protein